VSAEASDRWGDECHDLHIVEKLVDPRLGIGRKGGVDLVPGEGAPI